MLIIKAVRITSTQKRNHKVVCVARSTEKLVTNFENLPSFEWPSALAPLTQSAMTILIVFLGTIFAG